MKRFKGIKKISKTQLEEISPIEFRNASFEIFKAFIKFCDEHNLRYFLAGGTLIGALRHQGFVPWDDDMDITMPRPDFEKFRELTKDGKFFGYKRMSIYTTPKEHALPFDRIEDNSFFAETTEYAKNIYAWIDIFPWDGLPEKSGKHWKKVERLKKYSALVRWNFNKPVKGAAAQIKKLQNNIIFFCSLPLKIFNANYFARKIEKLGKQYDFEKCDRVGTFVAGYGAKEEMPKWWFIDERVGEKYLYFEGIKARVPAHYDLVLNHMYGDFMTLPKSKKTHIVQAYKVIKS